MNEKFFVTPLHLSTKRDYLGRMNDNKVKAMKVAKKYDFDYWDGQRRFGYGGYRYIEDRWKSVALKLIEEYDLTNKSKILDIGCGKGFLLLEIQRLLPKAELHGLDASNYGIKNAHPDLRARLILQKAQEDLKYSDNYFDLAISLGLFHNLFIHELVPTLKEFSRVSKKQYFMTESYRNEEELFNLQCWALTAETIIHIEDWKFILNMANYKGDYEFIFFT